MIASQITTESMVWLSFYAFFAVILAMVLGLVLEASQRMRLASAYGILQRETISITRLGSGGDRSHAHATISHPSVCFSSLLQAMLSKYLSQPFPVSF
jgi:hypothetical protein